MSRRTPSLTWPGERPGPDFALVLLLTGLAFLILRCAWVSDDAFITLRTLDNFVQGYGLRYNPAERVQAFTHPLWLAWLALPYAITREAWLTTMAVGGLTTLAAATGLAFGVARDRISGAVAIIGLASSKAFIDYTTSGLEGPLLWLLLMLFVAELYRDEGPRLFVLVVVSSLVALTRLDAILFVIPGLALVVVPLARQRDWGELAVAQLGWLGLVAWHGFSLVYYGSLVPNTAWAKLGSGISSAELMSQAPFYYEWTAINDPTTLPLVGLGVLLGALHRDLRGMAVGAGVALYLLYIVRIGGDFMGGRFFATPLFVSALLIARYPVARGWSAFMAFAILGLSLSSRYSPIRSGPKYKRAKVRHGVVDERGFYWRGTGLWAVNRESLEPSHLFARQGRARREKGPGVVNKAVIGMFGYYAGPEVHIVDRMALADPVLARLPIDEQRVWRIGHFERRVPDGYLARRSGLDTPVKPDSVDALVGLVDTVTRTPSLFDSDRIDAIWKLHDGTVGELVDDAAIHYPQVTWVAPDTGRAEVDDRGVGMRFYDDFQGKVRFELSKGIRWRLVARNGRRVVLDRTLWGDTVTERLPKIDKLIIYAMGAGSVGWSLEPKKVKKAEPEPE
ncbi:MAG: hypothetical protein AAGA48_14010 [Myxococcota bacterium]